MSINDRFNLFWITRAMTVSYHYDLEHYYYDLEQHNLFSVITLPMHPSKTLVLNKFSFMCDIQTAADIALRLKILANAGKTIIEIPRLSVKDKKEIQFQFLALLYDKLHHEECLLAVTEQPDEDGFVLADLLNRHNAPYDILEYWEELKLQLSLTFVGTLNQNVRQNSYLNN
jgi:hypothetical protein